jgi:predicted O-methyltransferase YrrM
MPRSEHEIGIVNGQVEDYLYSLLPKRDRILEDLEEDARRNSVPIIGPLVGTVISQIVQSISAESALEVGTATGYSGIWIGRSLKGSRRKLTTIELDKARIKQASASFKAAGISSYVEIIEGDARLIVPKIARKKRGEFDVVFLDVGEKTLYTDLLSPCLDALRLGGFLIADNTLWGGQVAVASDKNPETKTIRKFNSMVFSEKALLASIIPMRDGFTVAKKIEY